MIFIGIALLIAVGIALLISGDAGSLVGLTQAQTAQLIPLLVILIVFAGGLFTRRRKASELVGSVLLWIGIFGVAAVTYAYRDELTGMAGRVAGELRPGVAMVDAEQGIATFRRGMGGHFEINTTVNGHTTPMIFDTGASAVVLTIADAEAAGIDTDGLRFTIPVSTANGTGRAARVRLERIEVGGIAREGVAAFVTEQDALDMSLLGMTFLETLTRYSVTQNSLELVD
ncbi:MAG: TIGR02281 family clan AA aspartic protease [Alphaproteobacteria bacterium]|jgi:aspartyl protease family protein|nr:TIGR02281 family clan AA aspartic protease [Alphaproteobacteria bacterium]MBU1563308.1 TIGR02281 family clan AA aspartic protease [Alphaproteobacteria bacterium]MBU2302031.1 TIGR02281 family clan AA aspartic protease [Alphaproteobacteria bacterium]MBU2367287.1 TIGR02281 family clan AA aspartic protease [Alphaproteobacteria bacterium]